jgi:hypothetical protein
MVAALLFTIWRSRFGLVGISDARQRHSTVWHRSTLLSSCDTKEGAIGRAHHDSVMCWVASSFCLTVEPPLYDVILV